VLRRRPNKEYLVEEGSRREARLLAGLADILMAFCYDHRCTQGDPNVESAWTVHTISPTLCWLEEFDTPREALTAAMRRSLAFPYLRNWRLSRAALEDAAALLSAGRRPVLRALLQVRRVMETDETRYLLNRLYLDDYCVWAQRVSDRSLSRLASAVAAAAAEGADGGITRADCGNWGLAELEDECHRAVRGEWDDKSHGDGDDDGDSGSDSDSSSSSSSSESESESDIEDEAMGVGSGGDDAPASSAADAHREQGAKELQEMLSAEARTPTKKRPIFELSIGDQQRRFETGRDAAEKKPSPPLLVARSTRRVPRAPQAASPAAGGNITPPAAPEVLPLFRLNSDAARPGKPMIQVLSSHETPSA
jgi:hypothetical protein